MVDATDSISKLMVQWLIFNTYSLDQQPCSHVMQVAKSLDEHKPALSGREGHHAAADLY